jgi:hypothetical protein
MKLFDFKFYFQLFAFGLFTLNFRLISSDAENVFKSSADSVVKITTYNQLNRAMKIGSGVFLGKSKSKYPNFVASERRGFIKSNEIGDDIISNYHVIAFASKIIVQTKNGEKSEAGVIYFDSDNDIAILRTAVSILKNAPRIATKLNIGQKIFSIGNPSGFDWSISDGIISGFRTNNSSELIQFTAPISAGSSGGGLFNSDGELVGLPTLQIRDSQNLNFAVNLVKQSNFDNNIIRSGILVIPDALEVEDWGIGYFYAPHPSAPKEYDRFENKKTILWNKYKSTIDNINEIKFSESFEGKLGLQTENPALFVLDDARRFLQHERSRHFEYDINGKSYSGSFQDDESKSKHIKQISSLREKFKGVLDVESNYYTVKSGLVIKNQDQINVFQKEIIDFLEDMPKSSDSNILLLTPNARNNLDGFINHIKRVSIRFKMIDVDKLLDSNGF